MRSFEIIRDVRFEFRFRLRDEDNKIILRSEGYLSKQGCLNGIESVKTHASNDLNYRRKIVANGQFYFNLVARNNEVIGTSHMYDTQEDREDAIKSVMDGAKSLPIVDLT